MPIKQDRILDYTQTAGRRQYTRLIREHLSQRYATPPLALVHSFGCQQNAADGEKLRGMLAEMGYGFTDALEEADLILYNTCAVRENAEKRVLGTVGALKHYKRQKPELLIALVGCMTQQQSVADKLKRSYPQVDIVAGADAWASLPERIYEALCLGRRSIKEAGEEPDTIVENLPARRAGWPKAWVTVMYGCNNFCSYCIVPYVRGRERSRRPEDILREVAEVVGEGYRDITLLGQNVNSYNGGIRFPELLRQIGEIPGDFLIRFMTSHPKDCTRELLDVMAECPKVAKHLHLPVQSGSDRILAQMNRRYTTRDYLALVAYARERMPELSLTSDIIVGFPGETREDFEKTLALVREVGYTALYTFLYSRRSGTKAVSLPDPVPPEEKSRWFQELLQVQAKIGEGYMERQVGSAFRVLVEGPGKGEGMLTSRNDQNVIVEFPGPAELAGSFAQVEITSAKNWALTGRLTGQGEAR